MPKTRRIHVKYQLDMLQKLFLKANVDPLKEDPWAELKKIDWKVVDPSLTLAENLHTLKTKYSDYSWDLYASIDEIFADELSRTTEVEVKPFEHIVKGKTYRYGRIQATVPEMLIGHKLRIVLVESLKDYIEYWRARRKGAQIIGLDDYV
jgi:hypothetical protein